MTVIRFDTELLFFLSCLIFLIWYLAYKNEASGNSFFELINESLFSSFLSRGQEMERKEEYQNNCNSLLYE